MNDILQYDENTTNGKGKNKNIVSGDKWKFNASITLLKRLKANDHVSLLNLRLKTIKDTETDNIISHFHVGYMSLSF